jgi:M3 family oligoendopeptidase
MTVFLPDLSHRLPETTWLEDDLPERIEAEWLRSHYDAILAETRTAGDDGDAWVALVRRTSELEAFVDSHHTRVSVAAHQATDDDDVQAEYGRWNREVAPVQHVAGVDVARAFVASPRRDAIDAAFGEQFLRLLDGVCRSNAPVNTELRTKVSDLVNRHSKVFGTATITWRGEELPFSYLRKSALDEDRGERHAAWNSMVTTIQASQDELENVFDELLDARFQMAENLGFDSYIELRYLEMGRFDWNAEDAQRVRHAVEQHIVPIVAELQRAQAQHHGTERLHPADSGLRRERTPQLGVEIEGQLDAAKQVFDALGDSFGTPFRTLVGEGLVDLAARPGKSTGAFCTSFPFERVPFICCNSVGTPDDVRTLVHEFGHALQGWRSRDIDPVDLRWPTLEACEIHSMSLELLAQDHLAPFFASDEDLEIYARESHGQAIEFMPYMAAIDEFQHRVYDERLDRAGRAAAWRDVADRYQPAVDWDANEWYGGARWILQNHLFGAPFYYLDYGLAQLVAWQLWLDSLEDRDSAIERYLKLCSEGGTKPFRQLVLEAGLKDPFDEAVIADTVARLRPHLGL